MERNREIDVAKGIAIYLVVLGHLLTQIGNYNVIVISFCHMPFFFFVSGYFMNSSVRKYGKKVFAAKKIRTLLVPYVIWSFVSFLANVLAGAKDRQAICAEFISIFLRARSVWFLIELFISMMIFVTALYIAQAVKINWLVVSVILWLLLSFIVPNAVLAFMKFKWLFPFMLAGYILAEKNEDLNIEKSVWGMKILFFLFPLGAYFFYRIEFFDVYQKFLYANLREILIGMGYYLISFWGICFLLLIVHYICSRTEKTQYILSEAGKYTIHIYVMHMFMVKFLFLAPEAVREHRFVFLWIYLPVYSALVVFLIVFFSKRILEKSKCFRIAVGKGWK